MRRAEISAIKDMSCQKNSKLIKVEGSVFFFSSENGIKTCLERRAPPVPSAPKAAPASVLLCPCILITTLLIFMRLGTQGGLQSVILSLSLSLPPPHLSQLNLWGFFFLLLPNSWYAADPYAAACACSPEGAERARGRGAGRVPVLASGGWHDLGCGWVGGSRIAPAMRGSPGIRRQNLGMPSGAPAGSEHVCAHM